MSHRFHRKMNLGKVGQVGIGAVESGSGVAGWVGYGVGLAMLGSGIWLGLAKGQLLYGGLVAVAAPVVGGVVGHYLANAPSSTAPAS